MLKFYLAAQGRISRKAYWLAVMLPFIAIGVGSDAADRYILKSQEMEYLGQPIGPMGAATTILLIWPSFATAIRRFHDLRMTGWCVLVLLPFYVWMPDPGAAEKLLSLSGTHLALAVLWCAGLLFAMIFGLAQLFVPGTRGPNKYGPDPLEAK